MDTVVVGDGWTLPPFRALEQDNKIYGRGACDMKSGLACCTTAFIHAATLVQQKHKKPKRTLKLICTVDEEDFMRGSEQCIQSGWVGKDDWIVDAEPTNGMIQVAHKGRTWYEVDVQGHTAHATAKEAEDRTIQMLNVYADFLKNVLAIPVVKGQKTEKEKFAGAEATYTIEALMHDGKALQSGTSHNFGDGFAKAFGIQFTDKDNTLKYVHQTSWGMTTRLIGAVIMVHGDDSGLKLPPKVAPTQIMIIPIQQKKEGVLDKAYELRDRLIEKGYRVKVDDTDKSPGWKFSECEMRGVPFRIEIGPKDIENGKCVFVRRDTREKIEVALDEVEAKAEALLEQIHNDMYERAKAHLESHTYSATNWDEFCDIINNKPGFVKAMWCGCQECEDKIKEELAATSRCIPFEQETLSDVCVCCGKPAKKMVYWGRAY